MDGWMHACMNACTSVCVCIHVYPLYVYSFRHTNTRMSVNCRRAEAAARVTSSTPALRGSSSASVMGEGAVRAGSELRRGTEYWDYE